MSLTPRQRDLLTFVAAEQRRTGVSPKYADIARALGLKSKANVARFVAHLQERGYVSAVAGRKHGIVVLRLPDDVSGEWLQAVSTTALFRELKRRDELVEQESRAAMLADGAR
jgi:SOS-response transcriptional repressor LexA